VDLPFPSGWSSLAPAIKFSCARGVFSGPVFGKIRFGCRTGGGKGLDESELVLVGVSRAFRLDVSSTRASSASCRGALWRGRSSDQARGFAPMCHVDPT